MSTARRTLWAAVVIVLIALTVAGARLGELLSGGGLQPTALMPADVAAAVSIDLDPALDQKVAALRFIRHFPEAKNRSDDQLKLDGLKQLLPDCVDPDRDLASWFGQRLAIATPAGTRAVLMGAVQIRNGKVGAARDAISRIETCSASSLHLAIRDHYVLLSTDLGALTRMRDVSRADSLNRSPTYRADLHELHGNQIATAWGDGEKVRSLLRSTTESVPGADVALELLPESGGRAVLGLHATGSVLELQLATLGGPGGLASPASAGPETIAAARSDSMAALYVMPDLAQRTQAAIDDLVPHFLTGNGNFITKLIGLPTVKATPNADGSRVISLGPARTAEETTLRARALATLPGQPAVVAFIRPGTIPRTPRSFDTVKAIGLVATRSGMATLRVVV